MNLPRVWLLLRCSRGYFADLLENPYSPGLMVWTPARLYAASQWAKRCAEQHPNKRGGSGMEITRIGIDLGETPRTRGDFGNVPENLRNPGLVGGAEPFRTLSGLLFAD